MTAEESKKLEEMFDMTAHKGWIIFMEDLQNRVDALKEGLATREATTYQQGLAHGHIKVYRELQNLRAMLEYTLKPQEEDEDVQIANV